MPSIRHPVIQIRKLRKMCILCGDPDTGRYKQFLIKFSNGEGAPVSRRFRIRVDKD